MINRLFASIDKNGYNADMQFSTEWRNQDEILKSLNEEPVVVVKTCVYGATTRSNVTINTV